MSNRNTITTELYLTGRIGGAFFKNTKGINNPVKWYIECCLYKNRLVNCRDLIDDCYNEAFRHLCEIPDAKFYAVYNESPQKLIAWLLRIISLKCFAIDPRYGNPKHSFIQSLLFTGSLSRNVPVEHCDYIHYEDRYTQAEDKQTRSGQDGTHVVGDKTADLFTEHYGFTVEDIVAGLNDQHKAIFYGMVGKQPRGKVSAGKEAQRQIVINQIVNIKQQLSA